MKVLQLAFLFASASALAASASSFTIEAVNATTISVPAQTAPHCLPISTNTYTTDVAVIIGDGTNADAYVASIKYLQDRNAKIHVFCSPSSQNVLNGITGQALLMRSYYPMGKVSCTSISNTGLEGYPLIIVPDGYAATLPMRRDEKVQKMVAQFATNTERTSNASLVLLGGATEVLIDSGVMDSLDCKKPLPVATTPAVESAIAKKCGHADPAEPRHTTHHLAFGSQHIFVGNELPALLAHWEAMTFNTAAVDTRCNSTATTNPFDYQTSANAAFVSNLTAEDWTVVTAATDANAEVVDGSNSTSVSTACTNADGVDFCLNAPTSVVVAHGSHARAVRSVANVLSGMRTIDNVFCPDAQEEQDGGFVYLSAEPGYIPTHRIKCTAYYNRTDVLTSTLVFIAGGEIATHGTLRTNANLIKALQYTGTFSAFGSAMTLLNAIENSAATTKGGEQEHKSEVTNAPYYLPTNVDMSLLGLNASTANVPVMLFRDSHERRTKVLGGYRKSSEVFEKNIIAFLTSSAKSLVWANAPTATTNIYVLAYVFGISGVVLVGLLTVLCIRANSKTSRNARTARSRSNSDASAKLV